MGSASDKTLLPTPVQGLSQSSSSLSSGQFQSLGTIKSKKKTILKPPTEENPTFSGITDSDDPTENNNEPVEIPFEPSLNQHPSNDERYFCQLLYPEWENEVKKTQPLSKQEIQQWAIKQPKMAK